jgi:hypothetical protein
MGTNYKINTMKKSIYQHIADTYKDEVPTLEQVTAIIKEHSPNISSPSLTFDELVTNIYENYTSWTK